MLSSCIFRLFSPFVLLPISFTGLMVSCFQYDTKYYYKIGQGDSSREFWFQTPPKIHPDASYKFGIIGELFSFYTGYPSRILVSWKSFIMMNSLVFVAHDQPSKMTLYLNLSSIVATSSFYKFIFFYSAFAGYSCFWEFSLACLSSILNSMILLMHFYFLCCRRFGTDIQFSFYSWALHAEWRADCLICWRSFLCW